MKFLTVRSLTHAPETVAINSTPNSGTRRQSMTLEVAHRHEKLAPESGVELGPWRQFLEPLSGACVTGLSLYKTVNT